MFTTFLLFQVRSSGCPRRRSSLDFPPLLQPGRPRRSRLLMTWWKSAAPRRQSESSPLLVGLEDSLIVFSPLLCQEPPPRRELLSFTSDSESRFIWTFAYLTVRLTCGSGSKPTSSKLTIKTRTLSCACLSVEQVKRGETSLGLHEEVTTSISTEDRPQSQKTNNLPDVHSWRGTHW